MSADEICPLVFPRFFEVENFAFQSANFLCREQAGASEIESLSAMNFVFQRLNFSIFVFALQFFCRPTFVCRCIAFLFNFFQRFTDFRELLSQLSNFQCVGLYFIFEFRALKSRAFVVSKLGVSPNVINNAACRITKRLREVLSGNEMISELKSAYESAARMRESPAHRKIVIEIVRALRESEKEK